MGCFPGRYWKIFPEIGEMTAGHGQNGLENIALFFHKCSVPERRYFSFILAISAP
jgi:hypothetical protein